jgi:hypothetical protein
MAASLRAYLASEVLDGENSYQCETCARRCPAHKSAVLRHPLPPIMTFSLQRFGIDRTTWERVKLKDAFEFPLALDMDLYAEGSTSTGDFDVHLPIGDASTEKDYVEKFRDSMLWLRDATAAAHKHAAELVDTALAISMASAAEAPVAEGTAETSAINPPVVGVEDVWRLLDDSRLGSVVSDVASYKRDKGKPLAESSSGTSHYELQAVIMHCGSAYSGHYFAYIRDLTGSGKWTLPKDNDGGNGSSKTASVGKSSGGHSQSSSTATSRYHSDNFRSLGDNMTAVNLDSPLGVLVSIIIEEGLPNEANSTSSALNVGKVGAAIKKRVGKNWREAFGIALIAFVNEFSDKLISHDPKKDMITVWNTPSVLLLDGTAFFGDSSAPNNAEVAASVSSGVAPDSTSDEGVAAALQMQFDSESAAVKAAELATADIIEDDGEWIPAGTKRSNKAKTPRDTVSSSTEVLYTPVAVDTKEVTQQVDTRASDHREALIDEVTQRLLNKAFGEFYEFNDSVVRPIRLSTISRAFESTNCGYILVYRKSEVMSWQHSTARSTSRLHRIEAAHDVPDVWRIAVAEEDAELKAKRLEYESATKSDDGVAVLLKLFCPVHLQVDPQGGSLLIPSASTELSEELYVYAAAGSTLTDVKAIVWEHVSRKVGTYGLSVSSATTAKLKSKVIEQSPLVTKPRTAATSSKKTPVKSAWDTPLSSAISSQVSPTAALPSDQPVVPYTDASSVDDLCISLLKLRGSAGWIAMDSIESSNKGSGKDSISDINSIPLKDLIQKMPPSAVNGRKVDIASSVILHSPQLDITNLSSSPLPVSLNLFLWNGSDLGGVSVPVGAKHEPRLFVAKLLSPGHIKRAAIAQVDSDGSAAKAADAAPSRPRVEGEVEMWISASCPVRDVCLRAVRAVLGNSAGVETAALYDVYVVETYGLTNGNHSRDNAKGIYGKILWDSSINSLVKAVKKDSTAKDLQGSELLVELSLPRSQAADKKAVSNVSDKSLSLLEVLFRNKELELFIDIQGALQNVIRQSLSDLTSGRKPKLSSELDLAIRDFVADERLCDKDVAQIPSKIYVDHNATLFDLKCRILKIFIRHEQQFAPVPASESNADGSLEKAVQGLSLSSRDEILVECLSHLSSRCRIVADVPGIIAFIAYLLCRNGFVVLR